MGSEQSKSTNNNIEGFFLTDWLKGNDGLTPVLRMSDKKPGDLEVHYTQKKSADVDWELLGNIMGPSGIDGKNAKNAEFRFSQSNPGQLEIKYSETANTPSDWTILGKNLIGPSGAKPEFRISSSVPGQLEIRYSNSDGTFTPWTILGNIRGQEGKVSTIPGPSGAKPEFRISSSVPGQLEIRYSNSDGTFTSWTILGNISGPEGKASTIPGPPANKNNIIWCADGICRTPAQMKQVNLLDKIQIDDDGITINTIIKGLPCKQGVCGAELVHERIIYGLPGHSPQKVNATWETLIDELYAPFKYAIPAMQKYAKSRKYRLYVIYSDELKVIGSTVRIKFYFTKTKKEVIFSLPRTAGNIATTDKAPNRDAYTEFIDDSIVKNENHAQIRAHTHGDSKNPNAVIKYIALQSWDFF